MDTYIERAGKIVQRINELASASEDGNCLTRTYGTPAFIEGRSKVEHWMKQAGLQTSIDHVGNVRGRLKAGQSNAQLFMIASHIDTVINAGRFDGPLGVLIGLDIAEQIMRSKSALPFHLDLVGFCDEEGCRFHSTYLGSKAVAGSFDTSLLDARDAGGISLRQAIEAHGGNAAAITHDAIPAKDWAGYFEVHIEQGPVLYEKNIPVALVTAIAGQCRVGLVFNGTVGHAGTVPMPMRKDALACAAEFVLEVEKFALANQNKLLATVGKLHIINPASNVIPGEVISSLDLRSADSNVLVESYREIKRMAEAICERRGIVLEWNLVHESKPVACDAALNKLLAHSIREAGYELIELVSGAGHDAVPVSAVSPVSMLFVRCFKGISHNPLEDVELKDIAAALKVSDNFIQQLIKA